MITDIVFDNLVTYVFGNYLWFGLFVMFGFVISLAAARVNVLLGLVIGAPFFVSIVSAGWFGAYPWIKPLLAIIMALIWGMVLWKLSE